MLKKTLEVTMRKRLRKNNITIQSKGSALIVSLLIVTLVATIATMISLQQQTQIARTSLILNNDRTYLYAKAVENWAIFTLLNNLQQANEQVNSKGNTIKDILVDELPKSFDEITVNHAYHIAGHLDDAQSRFNLNNLVKKSYEAQFVNLMLAVDPDLNYDKAKAIAKATHDWVNSPKTENNTNTIDILNGEQKNMAKNNSNASNATPANSSINRYYIKRQPPYRAAQALMSSASELRLVKGMTPALYLRLQPFIIALPKITPININTASAPVIASLGNGIPLSDAISIVQNRSSSPFNRVNDFLTDSMVQRANVSSVSITLNSTYFLVSSETKIGDEKNTLTTLLYRPLTKDNGDNDDKTSDNAQENDKTVINQERDKEQDQEQAAEQDKSDSEDQEQIQNQEQEQQSQKAITILWESRGGI